MSISGDNQLLIGDSHSDANLRYASGVLLHDPFACLQTAGRLYLLVNDIEALRLRKSVRGRIVVPLSTCLRWAQAASWGRKAADRAGALTRAVAGFAQQRGIRKFYVPANFPLGVAKELRDLGIRLKPRPDPFFPERGLKTPGEVRKISATLVMAEVGMAEAIQALRTSRVGAGGKLILRGAPLTSDRLRAIIDCAILQAGGMACSTIVAGGTQACDPHEPGHGPLKAGQAIVLDVFPRSVRTGYYADITRTVVKGRAPDAIRAMYLAVKASEELGISLLREGVSAAGVHERVAACLAQQGFKTGTVGSRSKGFFHGTGHGLGLDLHELPRISERSNDVLRAGQVVTVEPGLYYPGIGGVRLEDVALITRREARVMTDFERVLEV